MPLRLVRHSSRASAISVVAGVRRRQEINRGRRRHRGLVVGIAGEGERAVAQSMKTTPPWQTPWPFVMSSRTLMLTRAQPGLTAVRLMPKRLRGTVALVERRRAALRQPLRLGARWGRLLHRAAAQRPLKRGVRLAANAATPSA